MKCMSWLFISIVFIVFGVIKITVAQVTIEQAKQSIRLFEGDPNMELPEPKEDSNPYAPVARNFYRFDLPDKRTYEVDKETGWVSAVFYRNYYAYSHFLGQKTLISQEQAIQIARTFLDQRSIVYQKYKARMDVKCDFLDDRYSIEFIEKILENGAYTYNQCFIDIDPYNGEVMVFSQMWEKAQHPNRAQQPTITAQEAANNIAAYFGFSSWDFFKEPKLLALPADWQPFNWNSSGLVWCLDIVGNGGWEIQGFVDALKGTILMTNKYRSFPSSLPKVKNPKVRLWVCNTERIEETPAGYLITDDGFALKGLVPIIQKSYDNEFTWLPVEIFKRFGVKVKESKGLVSILIGQDFKIVNKFLKQNNQIYLPAKLLEDVLSNKIAGIMTKEVWVVIYVRDKDCLKPFEDLREEISVPNQTLRYKTKYRSFLDRREWQWGIRIGICLLVVASFLVLGKCLKQQWVARHSGRRTCRSKQRSIPAK